MMAPPDGSLRVGMRVAIGPDRATVRYVGPVQGQAGAWVGVEWDDPSRGKHDGSLPSSSSSSSSRTRYFSCAAGEGSTTGSFVRAEKVRAPLTVEQALLERYCGGSASSAGSGASSSAAVLLPTASGRRLVEVELVGEARVRERLANTRLLTSARLVDAGIGRAVEGEGEEEQEDDERLSTAPAATIEAELRLASLAPNLAELDLSGNLLSDWSQVGSLCRALPALRVLDLSGNRVRLPPPSPSADDAALPPLRLRTLVLNDCGASVTWPALVALVGSCLPELTALHARRCGIRSLGLGGDGDDDEEEQEGAALPSSSSLPPSLPLPLPAAALANVRALDLEGNSIASWREIERLRDLPSLERLQLSGNPIGRVWCRSRSDGDDATDGGGSNNSSFPHLSALTLGSCNLRRWADVDALDALLPGLAELRLSGNPVTEEAPGGGRFEAVARCRSLVLLNGAAVRPRERRDSELRYVHGLLADAHEAAGPGGVAALVAAAEAGEAGGAMAAGSAAAPAPAAAAAAVAERLVAQNPRLLLLLRRYLAEAETLATTAAGQGKGLREGATVDGGNGGGGAQGALAALAAAAALAASSQQQQQQPASSAAAATAAKRPPAAAAAAASAAIARGPAVIVGRSAAARRAGGGGGGATLAASALDVTAAAASGGGNSNPLLPPCRLPPSATMGVVASLLRRMVAAERRRTRAQEQHQQQQEEDEEDEDDEGGEGGSSGVRVALVPAAAAAAAAAAPSETATWEEADEDARLGDVVAGLPGGPYSAGGWVVAVQVV